MANTSTDTPDACISYLTRLSYLELFRFSLTSLINHRRVTSHLQRLPSREIDCTPLGERSGAFKEMPLEVIETLLILLPMRDRIMFGSTCRLHRAVANRALLSVAAACLRPYSLTLVDLRFLQSCTRATISGVVLKRMLRVGSDCRRLGTGSRDALPVTAPALDVYCAKFEGMQVAEFISMATGYTRGPYIAFLDTDAIRVAHTLTKAGAPNINVFESRTPNPLDAILRLPTTADMGAWLLDRIWHGYPRPTFEGSAMTTPTRLPVDTLNHRQRAWDVIQSSLQDGYWIDSQWSHPHACLTIADCPSTWRRTLDRGCLTMKFPTLPHTAIAHRAFEDVSWSLGTITTCNRTWLSRRRPEPRSFRYHEYEGWLDHLFVLTKMTSPPV
ncbi:hypothetical protein C8R47DRAFT_1065331 [Mycena vitilis]|nr:hypothetical protein C8R47DRAFT_1065331 [Mycena vitilis]